MEAVQTLSEYEVERGKPMPSLNHSAVQTSLIVAFSRHLEKYSILSELSLELDGTPYVPDISVYPRISVDWQHDHVKQTDPPLTVVEILSPTQSLDALIRKAEAYFEAGVRSCWIVQPVVESIVVLEPRKKLKVHASGEVVDPPTGITVKIEEIFHSME